MQTTHRALVLCTLLAACSSKVTQTIDTDLQNKVNTVNDCLPEHLAVLDQLIEFAKLWRLTNVTNPADPSGLTWSEQVNGTINYSFVLTGFTISGVISFYDSTGALQDLTLSTTSLSQAIDDAATALRPLPSSAADSFMVATWTLADTGGPVESGNGALTGIIGGSTNLNELEEVRTTTGSPAGGPPPNATQTITIVDGADTCTLTFDTPHAPATTGLRTDEQPTQDFPIGTIHFSLVGPDATVTADLTFDGTAVAQLTVSGVNGRFDINLNTLSITFVP